MSMVRARELVLCVAVAGALAGCATSRLSSEAPPGVHLAGLWKLDRGASDDPQKAIAMLREAALKRMRHPPSPEPVYQTAGRGGRGRGGGAGGGTGPAGEGGEQPMVEDPGAGGGPHGPGPGFDPLRNSSSMYVLNSTLARGEFLSVKQTTDQVVLGYGDTERSFTPGAHSVVSSQHGVADQISGWKGKEYVIYVRPQYGPEVIEQYGLSPDGQHLVMKLHIGTSDLPKVDLTRVYDPTKEIAPRAVPSVD